MHWQGGFHFLLSVERSGWRKKIIFHQHCWLDCAPVLLTQICAGPFENQSRLIQNYLKYNYSLENEKFSKWYWQYHNKNLLCPHMPYCIYAQLIKCLMVANTWCQHFSSKTISVDAGNLIGYIDFGKYFIFTTHIYMHPNHLYLCQFAFHLWYKVLNTSVLLTKSSQS